MLLCQQIYRRCARVALALAVVLIASPALLKAQSDDTVPKAEWFIGYQWWNPGGNLPDSSAPPVAYKAPSSPKGLGTNVSYNFTNNLSLEGNWGGNWNSTYNNNAFTVGPKLTFRGEGVNFFVHTLIGVDRFDSNFNQATTGVAAVLGGG